MLHLKKRRGAMVVMTGIMFFALVICGAVAIDFGRLWTERSELQSAADAGALAGGLQLMTPRDTLLVDSVARAFVHANRAMADTITVDSVINGNWDGPTRVWTPAGSPTNAVRVVVSQRASNLFMAGFGVPVPRMTARAIAWAGAPVTTTTSCIKPWAIPYEELMYRINLHRNITPANSNANLTRPFDQSLDMAALLQMSPTEKTFNLKLASQTPQGAYDPTSGNYQAVRLGKWWDYATQGQWTGQSTSSWTPAPDQGANAYEGHIAGVTCHGLAVGDVLDSEPGDKVGKTLQGICKNGNIGSMDSCNTPAVCSILDGPTGDCYALDGTVGVDVKAAFFSCAIACAGQSKFEVKLLGAFTLKKAFSDNGTDPVYGQYSSAQLVGEFKPVQAIGGAGGGSTTLVKVILVQ